MNGFDFFWGADWALNIASRKLERPVVVELRRPVLWRPDGGLPSFVTNPRTKEGSVSPEKPPRA